MQESFDDLFDNLPTPGRMRSIRRDLLDTPIATVMDSERASRHYLAFMRGDIDETTLDAELENCILERGMTKGQIEEAFPPCPIFPGQSDLSFNLRGLVATIIWQEWKRVGQRRPKGNIRHFWYTHLMYTLTRVMKHTNIASISTCFNEVLKLLVRHEGFRYTELNFVSTKSKLCEAIFADSPYPNIILACEKESYHEYLKPLAHVFHLTFISLAGQPSYGAFEDLVFQFMEYGIELDQEFRILVITDYDPHGYKIQGAAKDHLERAGIRRVMIERVYLCPEHITPGIIERFAVPYEVEKHKDSATKAACTLYNRFGAETGGIYKRRATGELVQFPRNGNGYYHVPQLTDGPGDYTLYRVELDNFREDVLVQLLIDALERIIDGAEYYYAAAASLWRRTIRGGAWEAAQALIQRVVKEKIAPIEQSISDIRERLSERWEALTTEEDLLIEQVKEDCDYQVESLQERIDNIQEQIDALRDEQRDLESRQEAYRATEDDVLDFLHNVKRTVVPAIPTAEEILEPIDDRLTAYGDEQESTHTDTVRNRFNQEPEPVAIREVIDGRSHAGAIFRQARAGAKTFTAELSYSEQRRVTSDAEDDLEAQQEAMTVEVPDLPDNIMNLIDARIQRARELLEQADRTGELSDEWQSLLRLLRYHYERGDVGWNPWDDWENGGWQA